MRSQQLARPRRRAGSSARGQPGIVTSPPVTSAAARNGAALDRSGSMCQSRPGERAGLDRATRSASRRRPRRRPRAASARSSRGAARRHRRAVVAHRHAARRTARPTAAARRRTGDDADASIVTSPPGTPPVPCTVNGSAVARRRPAPSAAQRVQERGHRPVARVRVAVERDVAVGQRGGGRQEPHHGAGQAAVDVGRAVQRVGRDQPGPSGPIGDARRRATAARRPSARCRGCAAARAGWTGRSASAASTSARLVIDLEPGTGTVASTGPSAVGADHC